MHYSFRSAMKHLASGQIVLTDGVLFDILTSRIEDPNAVETMSDIAGKTLGLPQFVPLATHADDDYIQFYTTLEEAQRMIRWAVPETTQIHGMICYSSSGKLLFFIDFGGIRQSVEGAFNMTFPETLLYMRMRVSG